MHIQNGMLQIYFVYSFISLVSNDAVLHTAIHLNAIGMCGDPPYRKSARVHLSKDGFM